MPMMSRVSHGLEASSGPMYISYSRIVSQPYCSHTSSGLTAFRRLLPIFPSVRVTGAPW